jgi:cell division protein FtsB
VTGPRTAQTVFAQLSRERDLTDIDREIMRAFERLLDGRPEITDGSLNVVNIAAEAGVSRASYYRSPVAGAVKEILAAPDTKRPEVDELKAEGTRLRKELRDLRQEKAGEIRELKQTVAAYANQIQVLALRNAELEEDARKLRAQLSDATDGVVRPLR